MSDHVFSSPGFPRAGLGDPDLSRGRMRAAIQVLTRPHQYNGLGVRDNEVRSSRIWEEEIWGTAVHRVVAEGISPQQAVDEAIARIKQILMQ